MRTNVQLPVWKSVPKEIEATIVLHGQADADAWRAGLNLVAGKGLEPVSATIGIEKLGVDIDLMCILFRAGAAKEHVVIVLRVSGFPGPCLLLLALLSKPF
jgi:hypothetical protein